MAGFFRFAMLCILGLSMLASGQAPLHAVKVTAAPSVFALVRSTKSTFHVQLNVTAAETSEKENRATRTPFEMAIVLDCSGSMSGQKIERAKQAVVNVVENLIPGDLLHFVVYDTDVETVFRSGTVDQAEDLAAQVRRIRDRGMTNLFGGLERGYEVMGTRSRGRLQKVFLFSDGLVNVGTSDHGEIKALVRRQRLENGILTSAFGIGEDFDADLMMSIAEVGAGDYFFIAEAEDTERVVEVGLKGLARTVALTPRLRVRGLNGATVTRLFGFENADLGAGVVLSDVRRGGIKKLLIEVAVDATMNGELPSEELVEYRVDYTVVATEQVEEVRGNVVMEWVDSDKAASITHNAQVASFLQFQHTLQLEEAAREAMEKDQLDDALHYFEAAEAAYQELEEASGGSGAFRAQQMRNLRTMKTARSEGASVKTKLMSSFYSKQNKMMDSADDEL
eukprot:NODE_511_length_2163_cov_39.479186_g469_i0.p1 GENE.NODE_511_length_2163_cov_39.479186_g469_i0~~NODE_511_length_2163_cov_39.479186_g469_i0.p1  ORF type:complete len:451 (+),score=107.87 NODE_511_length_2163_cov_39.479186_g469_i0:697-2049(+)